MVWLIFLKALLFSAISTHLECGLLFPDLPFLVGSPVLYVVVLDDLCVGLALLVAVLALDAGLVDGPGADARVVVIIALPNTLEDALARGASEKQSSFTKK